MKFFLSKDDVGIKVDRILLDCKRYMDGDVVGKMKSAGINYRINYGVSRFNLKKVADSYDSNLELAKRLWFRETRESMMIATYLFPKEALSTGLLDELFSIEFPYEIVEQLAMNFIAHCSIASEIWIKWREEEDLKKCLAILGFARRIQYHGISDNYIDTEEIFSIQLDNRRISLSISLLWRQLLRKGSAELIDEISGSIDFYKNKGSEENWLYNEVVNEMIYLDILKE